MHTRSKCWQLACLRWLRQSTRAYPDHQLYRTTCDDGWGNRWSCKTPPCGGKLSSEWRSSELWGKCCTLVNVRTPIWERLRCVPCWEPDPQDFRTAYAVNIYFFRCSRVGRIKMMITMYSEEVSGRPTRWEFRGVSLNLQGSPWSTWSCGEKISERCSDFGVMPSYCAGTWHNLT